MAAIISFYKSFDINVPTLTLNKGDTILDKNDTPLITKEQLNKMLNVASARDKAIIYLLALSGMSQKEARDLTIKKYIDTVSQSIQKDILDIEWLFQYEDLILEEVLMINLTRDKAKFRRQTFIPPEVNRAIITYLKERKFNRNEKKHITDLNNALFVTNDGNPMSRSGITTAIRRVGEKAGFISEKGAHCYWKPHGCRKYVESTIINYNGDRILADYILGHKIDNVTRAYWKADPEQLKKRYLKVLPQLSLDGIKVKDYESKEYKQLVKDSVEKDKKISRMEQRMEIVEALLNDKGFVKELNDQ
jgi:integrase